MPYFINNLLSKYQYSFRKKYNTQKENRLVRFWQTYLGLFIAICMIFCLRNCTVIGLVLFRKQKTKN